MEELSNIFKRIEKDHQLFKRPYTAYLRFLESCEDKTEFVETLQTICNKLYDEYGIDENILDLQVYINEYRHKYDITDPREIIHVDNGKGFVQ